MTIVKKVWPKYFDAIIEGKKNFEIRLADFECKEGDTIILKEWNPKNRKYTGRKVARRVTYVVKTKDIDFWSTEDIEKHGLQVIGIK